MFSGMNFVRKSETVSTHLHLVPRLRMCEALPLFPVFAIMASRETTVCLPWPDYDKLNLYSFKNLYSEVEFKTLT
jgi:hypothetical protein